MSVVDDGAGMLTRSELAQLSRPAPTDARDSAPWVGSATGEVQHWRDRALRAEAAVASLRRALSLWRCSS